MGSAPRIFLCRWPPAIAINGALSRNAAGEYAPVCILEDSAHDGVLKDGLRAHTLG